MNNQAVSSDTDQWFLPFVKNDTMFNDNVIGNDTRAEILTKPNTGR